MSDKPRLSGGDVVASLATFFFLTCVVQTTFAYCVYFLTDFALVPVAAVSILLMIAQVTGVVSIPLNGIIVEKNKIKHGKYVKCTIMAAVMAGVFHFLVFVQINAAIWVKVTYYCGVYIVGFFAFNACMTAYLSLLSVMASTLEDRTLLSSSQTAAGFGSRVTWSLITLPLIAFLGGQHGGRGYTLIEAVYAILLMASCIPLFLVGRKYDFGSLEVATATHKPTSIREMLPAILRNKPLLLLMCAETTRQVPWIVISGLAVYYFRYVARHAELITIFFILINCVSLAGTALGGIIARKMDRKNLYLLGLCIQIGALVLARYVATNTTAFLVVISVWSVGFAIGQSLIAAMYFDANDYTEWMYRTKSRGIIMSMAAFPIQAALFIGSTLVIGLGLSILKYRPNAVPTPALDTGIINLLTLAPAIITALGVIVMCFYDLDKKKVVQIQEELRSRTAKQAPVEYAYSGDQT
jgi:GPH family glycoside/pentoside/hexuronide:cation symporter